MGPMIVFALAGLFCMICATLNVNWFMENRRARIFVELFGRTGARVFYFILGFAFTVMGILLGLNGVEF